jgi:two-component system, OmpR family, sensor histidine kinase CreC
LESPERIELVSLIVGVIDQSRPMADLRGVAISYQSPDPSPEVEGDPFILKSAVTNLMENAIDFAPLGTLVEIVVWRDKNQVAIDVCDHGPGIPEYARERIFERFYSLRHHQAGRKGTGLGLPLVKEAAELHGGSIELLPRDGGGTIARLKLVAV